MDEDQQRLFYRDELARRNQRLAVTATGAGVIKSKERAIFQDNGYQGLYAGETEDAIHERKDLPEEEEISDWMVSEEMAANIFRASQADAKIRREGITTAEEANAAHYQVGKNVRAAIIASGNTPPEQLPTPERSIREVERDERLRLEREAKERRQPSLFALDKPAESEK